MTLIQWLYHYKIIEKKEKEKSKYRHSLIKSVAEEIIEVFEKITKEQTEMLSLFIDKKLFKKYKELKDSKENMKETELSLEEEWAMMKEEPDSLEVKVSESENKKSKIKKISKKFIGIQKSREVD